MGNFILSGFGDEISPHLEEQVKVLQANGVSYLEFRNLEGKCIIDYDLPRVKEAYKYLDDHGIGVSAVGSPIGKISITESFPPHLERFKKTVATAQALHTGYIRMFSFYIPAGEDPASYRDQVLEHWSKFIEASKGSGLVLLHENERAIYGDTADRCLDLLEALNCDYVKATFDPANFIVCGEETYPRAFKLLEKHIAYLHIKDALYKDNSIVPAGQGDGKLLEILSGLKKANFSGYLSIEPHLLGGLPGGGPELFTVAVNALKDIIHAVNG